MSEVILFTSGKGGVGKTTITANIGAGLASRGYKTIIVDMNQGLRGTDIVLGLENLIVYNIYDALQKRCKLSRVIVKDPNRENLSLLSASQVRKQQDMEPEQILASIEELKKHFDYVLIDGCSGLDLGFDNSALYYDRAVIICTGDALSIRSADRVKDVLRKNRNRPLYILANQIRPRLVASKDQMAPEDIEELLGLDMLGVLTEQDRLYIASSRGETITGEETPAGQALQRITDRILGKEVPIPEIHSDTIERSGIWSFFRKG